MEFLSHRYREEWERLQVEMLRAQVTLEVEKGEQLRLANLSTRNVMDEAKKAPKPFSFHDHHLWGGFTGVVNQQADNISINR